MWHLAWRNLQQSRARFWLSAGGVGLSLTLVLALNAVVSGVEHQLAAYIERSGAEVWVAQKGIQNLHMVASTLPRAAAQRVAGVQGVASVTPILYVTQMVGLGQNREINYVFGLPPDAKAGGPWRVAAGKAIPGPGEVILDRSRAEAAGIGLGGEARVFGRRFRVAGLSEGTSGLLNYVAFVAFEDFARFRRTQGSLSYILVRVKAGESPQAMARRIEATVPGVSALSTSDFARQERKIIKDMGADAINLMNLAGFSIGLAVLALTVYTATLARRAEYGMLRAIGASRRHLYQVVLAQALLSVGLGLVLAVAFTLSMSLWLPWLGLGLPIQITANSLFQVGLASLLIAGLAAILPIAQVSRLDPAMVFRGGGR